MLLDMTGDIDAVMPGNKIFTQNIKLQGNWTLFSTWMGSDTFRPNKK